MRLRVLLVIVGSVVVSLALFGLPLGYAIGRAYTDDLHFRLESAALAASPELTEPDANLRPAEPPSQRGEIRMAYYDGRGRLVAGRGPAIGDEAVQQALRGQNGLVHDVVAVPVSRDDRVIGVVRAEEQPGLLGGRVHRAWLLMGLLGALVVGAVAGLATALVRRLTRPVHALAEAARRLEKGDFAVAPTTTGIHELDSAGLALAAAAQRLETVLARERALTADITHQLKTPLTALRLELEAGQLREAGPDIAAALAEVDRLESTIASILTLARDLGTARDPVRLAPLLEAVRRHWDRSAHAVGRPLMVRVEPANQAARVSELALRQILDVLIDNALRHGRGRIMVSAYPVASGVTVDVTDDGIVALDEAAIFARRSPTARGHGIGLALARSLAEAEGGSLALANGGAGARFSLLLPGSDLPPS